MLGELWKVDERWKELMEKLEEIRALDVESRQNDAERELAIIQNEVCCASSLYGSSYEL